MYNAVHAYRMAHGILIWFMEWFMKWYGFWNGILSHLKPGKSRDIVFVGKSCIGHRNRIRRFATLGDNRSVSFETWKRALT